MALRKIETWFPGLRLARTYQPEWFLNDLIAGLSVAAVALPIGIAYAQLAGFPPVVGIYSAIFPPVAYALFGSSRQLIVNPDAAACAIVAATVAPLAAGDAGRYLDLSIALTFLTGLFCIAGGIAGFGVIANFLSRPILTGYLNGIALSIIAGQLGTFLGISIAKAGFFRTVIRVAERLREINPATFFVAITLLLVLVLIKRMLPRVPAPLVAAALGWVLVMVFHLEQRGVAVVGSVPAGFARPHLPSVSTNELLPLVLGACGIVLVSFCSMMTTARGFAAKGGYRIKVNQDMFALGVSDLASSFSQGFAVSGADSRTAVADASGGKTQLATIIAAGTMSFVLLFLTGPLARLPTAALAAILMFSAWSLFDFASLRRYYRINMPEFRHSVVAMMGVMTVGALPGVLVAVTLALLNLLRLASRPKDAVLGMVDDEHGPYAATAAEGGRPVPGLIIYRFDASVLFFNSDYFAERLRSLSQRTDTDTRWILFDAGSVPVIDVSGTLALETLRAELSARGIVLVIARATPVLRLMLERSETVKAIGQIRMFPTVHTAVQTFLREQSRAGDKGADDSKVADDSDQPTAPLSRSASGAS